MTTTQLALVGALLAVVAGTQLLSFLSYSGLSRTTGDFTLAQDVTGNLADAQRDALRAQLAIERLSDGRGTVADAQLELGFLSRQLDQFLAQPLPADVRALGLDADARNRRLSDEVDALVDLPAVERTQRAVAMRADVGAMADDLRGLYARFEISFYGQLGDSLRDRSGTSRLMVGLVVLSGILGAGLASSLRRTVRKDFDAAYGLLVHEADERASAQEAVRHSEERFRALVQHSADIILVVAADGNVTYHSPSLVSLLPDGEPVIGSALMSIVHEDSRERLSAAFAACRTAPGDKAVVDIRLEPRSGSAVERHLQIRMTNLLDDEAVGAIVLNASDITDRVRHERDLAFLAFHDRLTGLPNRLGLEQELERLTAEGRSACVAVLDLDDFKAINDTFGHVVGDHALLEIARRLTSLARGTVAHLGGDEFAVLSPDLSSDEAAIELGTAVLAAARGSIDLDDQRLDIRASIGVAASSGAAGSGNELIRRADSAMRRAKTEGRGRVRLFDAAQHDERVARSHVADQIARAIERDELELHYQGLVSTRNGRVAGAEALMRWRRDGQFVPPLDFIPIAESSGLIVGLGSWVLDRACRDLARWQQVNAHFTVSVNVSAAQLHRKGFASEVRDAVQRHGADPCGLVIELTESAIVEDLDGARDLLGELRSIGLRVAVDDFGTGYSSLNYLMTLPVDIVKVDRSLIVDIATNVRTQQFIHGIIRLLHDMHMTVTVEGIEEPDQLRAVTAAGADTIQGFLLTRPVTAAELDPRVSDGGSLLVDAGRPQPTA